MRDTISIIKSTQSWIDQFVIGRNICPFAKHVPAGKLKLEVEVSNDLLIILEGMACALESLNADHKIETLLIIYPNAGNDFLDFLDLFYACDQLLEDLHLRDEFQLVSFHPKFCFDNAADDDAANFTNRSPYPMIHILRESTVSKAVDTHPDVNNIPERNMAYLRNKPSSYWAGIVY